MPIGLGGAALISGAASLIGSGLGALGSGNMNKKNRAMYRAQAQIQRNREDTAYQRMAADMEAAGINPLMAGGAGGSGSQAMSLPNQVNPMEGVAEAVANIPTSIAGFRNTEADTMKKEWESNQIREIIKNLGIERRGLEAEILNTMANTELARENILTEKFRRRLLEAQTRTEQQNYINAGLMATRLERETENILKQMDYTDVQIELARQNLMMNEQLMRRIEQEILSLSADVGLKNFNLGLYRELRREMIRLYKNGVLDAQLGKPTPYHVPGMTGAF